MEAPLKNRLTRRRRNVRTTNLTFHALIAISRQQRVVYSQSAVAKRILSSLIVSLLFFRLYPALGVMSRSLGFHLGFKFEPLMQAENSGGLLVQHCACTLLFVCPRYTTTVSVKKHCLYVCVLGIINCFFILGLLLMLR